jgi:hypothetical protein
MTDWNEKARTGAIVVLGVMVAVFVGAVVYYQFL